MPRAFQIPNLQISAVAKSKNILSSQVFMFFAVSLTFWALIWLVAVEFSGLTPSYVSNQLKSWMDYSPTFKSWVTTRTAQYNYDRAWVHYDDTQKVWGYADRQSIKPGEAFTVFLSVQTGTDLAKGTLHFYRIGGEENKLKYESVFTTQALTVDYQLLRPEASIVGADWTVGVKISKTQAWKSGMYVANFVYSDGRVNDKVAWIVVRPEVGQGDIIVKIPTNTLQAYNIWGGFSLYQSPTFGDFSSMVSFDRPTHLYTAHDPFFFIPWIETYAKSKKLKVDYISDFDLSTDPTVIDGYKLFVSHGHDEYWTKEMFDAVENRIFTKGKNAIFLGANTAYWQVRYVDVNQRPGGAFMGRQMICYKTYRGIIDPIAMRYENPADAVLPSTGLFRLDGRRPESMLEGVAYQSWFEFSTPAYDYTVVNNDLPFFEGTGLRPNDIVRGIVGYEWDNRDPEGDGKSLWSPSASLNKKIPESSIHVLFEGHPTNAKDVPGKAEAVYWQSAAGGKVFSSGTVWWAWGLSKPGVATPQFDKLNTNLFDYMLK